MKADMHVDETTADKTGQPTVSSAWASLSEDSVPVRRQAKRREEEEREERLRLLAPHGRR